MRDIVDVCYSYESISLLGPNGSGKSTLLKLINGLIFPVSGTYRFNGGEKKGCYCLCIIYES